MDEPTRFLIAVQALYEHCITLLDSCLEADRPEHDTLRNVALILESLMKELQEREDTNA